MALDRHPVAVYLARLSSGSRPTMRAALQRLADVVSEGRLDALRLDWSALRYAHTTALRTWLSERYAPSTANKMLAALRGVLREAWRLGMMEADVYHRAVAIESVRGSRKPTGRALRAHELRALFAACAADGGPAGVRDAALLALLYGVGLRRFEVAALALSDWQETDGTLWVARGKGRRARATYPPPGAQAALTAWLVVRGRDPGPLFWPLHNGRWRRRALSGQGVYYVVLRRAQEAQLERLSPHDLRRSFISDLLDDSTDLATVQSLAGHAHVGTTARYDRRGETPRRQAAARVHVPFVSPLEGGGT
jgi:site-specific recombinase XerD